MSKPIKYYKILKNNQIYMKIPEQIMILNTLWRIKLVKNLTKNGKRINGICNSKTKQIKLLSINQNIKRTLWHELTHAIFYELNWNQSETIAFTFGLCLEALYDQVSSNGELQPIEQGMMGYLLEREKKSIKEEINSEIKKIISKNGKKQKTKKRTKKQKKKQK